VISPIIFENTNKNFSICVYHGYETTMPRPKSFDPDTVLTKAMGVFWEKGFDAASISDLTEAMGINRFSLYDTFGDKHELYLKSLDAYDRSVTIPFIEQIESIGSMDELEAYLMSMVERQHSGKGGKGGQCCMMQKAAMTNTTCDQGTLDRVECARKRIHGAYRTALENIQQRGELRAGIEIEDAAWLLKIAFAGLASQSTCPVPKASTVSAFKLLIDSLRA